MEDLNYIDKKGEVTFYSDVEGNLLQQIGIGKPFPVDEKNATYKHVGSKNGYTIQYCTDGVSGYCILLGAMLVVDNLWTLKEADEKLLTLPHR